MNFRQINNNTWTDFYNFLSNDMNEELDSLG